MTLTKALQVGSIAASLLFTAVLGRAQQFTFKTYFPTPTYVNYAYDLTPDGHIVGWYTDDYIVVQSFSFKNGVTTKITIPQDRYPLVVAANASDYLAQGSFGAGYLIGLNGTVSSIQVPKTNTTPNGLNVDGEVVGSATTLNASGQATGTSGFLLQNGKYTTYSYPGSNTTVFNDISDAGKIVGYYTVAGSSAQHGFALLNGTVTPIASPGATSTTPTGVNIAGHVLGEYTDAAGSHIFYFDGAKYTTVVPPNTKVGGCTSGHIKNSGQIVLSCEYFATANSAQGTFPAYIGTPVAQ